MAKCSVTPKVSLTVLTVILWAAAAGLIFVGAWVYKEYEHYEQIGEATYTLVPATILMAIGVFIFLLGLIGCIGAFKEQRCLLGVFFTLLLVIVLGMIVTAVLGYVYRHDVDHAIEDGLEKALNNYNDSDDNVWTTEVDFMQQELQCCGIHNYSDWQDTPWAKQHQQPNVTNMYPPSCCVNETCDYTHPPVNNTALYQEGCYDLVKDEFMKHLGIIAGVAAIFTVVLILGMACSCILICRRKSTPPYIGLTSAEHLRV